MPSSPTDPLPPTSARDSGPPAPLKILHLEDETKDAELVATTLEAAGVACAITGAHDRAGFVTALERGGIDLILSDYALPTFDGLAALKIAHARWPAIPFIIVSGTLGEDLAVEALKCGATDYILKESLARLAPAIRRAMVDVAAATDRRQAEKASRRERDFTEMSLNSLPGIFYMYDQAGNFLRWNRNYERVSGYSAAELARMHPLDFFTGDERDLIALKLGEVFAKGAASVEAHFTAKDGTRTPYLLSGHRLLVDGRWCLIGTGIDVSERKALEARSIEGQRMDVIGQLAAGVAHDFNNILAVILGYSELMLQKLDPADGLRRHAGEIRHAAERAVGLTRQLLVFSHKQTVQPVVLDYNEVVTGMDQMLRRLIGEHIEMTIVPDSRIGRIRADSGYVGQVLMNLVVNARDAMPNGGKLTIATSNVTVDAPQAATHPGAVPGDYVMLSVKDTGTGMTAAVKARLFEAFFTTKPKGKGTGLGLATCQTIMQQSDGFIDVQSELGLGTTFNVYFPRVDQPLEISSGTTPPWPPPRGSETLLIVEDEASVRQLARMVLETQGYQVLSASNGQEGLQVAREHRGTPINLVITDLVMPVMGGKVMAEWLKSSYPDIKVLFTSGYTDETLIREAIIDRDMDYLAKPYTLVALARKVRELLDSPATPRPAAHEENPQASLSGGVVAPAQP